ncbi:MAG: tetratricopeptide repeat protein [Thermodesulfobacteriota bacterium]
MFEDKQNKTELKLLEKQYEQKLEDSPDSFSFVLLAEVLFKQNKIEKTIATLLKGLKNSKNMVTARFLLGKAYFKCWKIDLAVKELKKVIELAPDNFAAGELLLEINKSEKKYEDALKITENLSVYYRDNAKLKAEMNELIKMIDCENKNKGILENKDFKAPIQKNYVYGKSIFKTETLADIYIYQNQYEEALEIMEALLLKEPHNLRYREKYNKVTHLLSRYHFR